MASLKRIEELDERLDGKEPAWIRGYTKRDNHLSGALREMQERMQDPDISLDDIECDIQSLLEEAAETLDDAHENWLNLQVAGRALCGDIEAMADDYNSDKAEHWFGPFSVSREDWDRGGACIEWPNLQISATELGRTLDGKEVT